MRGYVLEIYLSEYVCPAAVLLVLIKPTNIMWVEDLYSAYVEAMVVGLTFNQELLAGFLI